MYTRKKESLSFIMTPFLTQKEHTCLLEMKKRQHVHEKILISTLCQEVVPAEGLI